MKMVLIIGLILGCLLVGSVAVLSKNKPLLEEGFAEIGINLFGDIIEDSPELEPIETERGLKREPIYNDLEITRVGDKLNITWEDEYVTISSYFYYEEEVYSWAEAISYGVTYDLWKTDNKFGGVINLSNAPPIIKTNGYRLVFEIVDTSDGVDTRKDGTKLWLDDNVYIDWVDIEFPANVFNVLNSTTIYSDKWYDTVIYDPILVIRITGAEHLDENRDFVKDIYDYVNETDNITYTIPDGEYVRAYFERNLTNESAIMVDIKNNESATVYLYEKDSDVIIGSVEVEDGEYYLYPNHTGNQSVFDLKSVGNVTYDYIIDPPQPPLWSGDLGANATVTIGENITYTGTAVDNGGESSLDWFLIVCSTDSIDYIPAAPSCDTGDEICRSGDIGSWGVEAECQYNTSSESTGDITYYGFLCGSDDRCSDGESKSATTTLEINYGMLQVNITLPLNDSNWNEGDTNLTINATVTCIGGECGTVYAHALYNKSSSVPDTLVNITEDEPFYVIGDEGKYISDWDTNADGNTDPFGITTNGTNIWTSDHSGSTIYKWDMDGNKIFQYYVGTDGNLFSYGITTDGTNIWTTDNNDKDVYKWNMDMIFQGKWDTNADGNTDPTGIATDGTNIWTTDNNDSRIYKWDMGGNYISNWSTAKTGNTFPYGITTDGAYIWITDNSSDQVYKYNMSGNYTSDWDTNADGNTYPKGIATDGTNIWTVDWTADQVYKWEFLNPNPQSITLSQGESWNVSWTLEVTTANIEDYLLAVKFNSSHGNALVPDNTTETRLIHLNPTVAGDTNFPSVFLISPENNTYWDVDNTPDFNYSAYDENGIDNCSLYINNTFNASFTSNANFTNTPISNGSYEWFVNCSDPSSNWNNTGWYNLTINYTIPSGDTCDCSSIQAGTTIDCSENCDIEACDANGKDLYFYGTGTILIKGDITNHGIPTTRGTDSSNKCIVICDGGCFKTT